MKTIFVFMILTLDDKTKNRFIRTVSAGVVLLFFYSGYIKLLHFKTFREQLLQSPLIPAQLISLTAIAIPLLEIALALMLFYNNLRRTALLWSTFLMFAFTAYLFALYTFFEKPPCACGGILGKVEYPLHIQFNLLITLCLGFAVWMQHSLPNTTRLQISQTLNKQ